MKINGVRNKKFIFIFFVALIVSLVSFYVSKNFKSFNLLDISNRLLADANPSSTPSAYLRVLSFEGYEYANTTFDPYDDIPTYYIHVYEEEEVDNLVVYYEKEYDGANVTVTNWDNGCFEVEVSVPGYSDLYMDYWIEAISDLDIKNMPYDTISESGVVKTYVVPRTGTYRVEAWGAAGGKGASFNASGKLTKEYEGGYGAYTAGTINLRAGDTFYVYIGGKGTNFSESNYSQSYVGGGWNGGGSGYKSQDGLTAAGAGGGATDIRLKRATSPSKTDDEESLKSRIMVAAGGGGGSYGDSIYEDNKATHSTAGGGLYVDGLSNTYCVANQTDGYARGLGSSGNLSTISKGGGGGGYFGGSGYVHTTLDGGAGCGGSSYISGHNGSIGINEDGSIKSSIAEDISSSYHYSGYVFTNTEMIDGFGYKWTNEVTEYTGMPNTMGSSLQTGSVGSGYVRIRQIAKYTEANNKLIDIETSSGTLSPAFSADEVSYELKLDLYTPEVTITGKVLDPSLTAVTESMTYKVSPGETKMVSIFVTDIQSTSVNTYTIKITRDSLKDNEHTTYLQKIKNPNHDDILIYKDTFTYDLPISYGKVSVDLDIIPYDKDVNIEIKGNDFLENDTGVIEIIVKDDAATPSETKYTLNYSRETSVERVEDKYLFDYTGAYQTFDTPMTGDYRLEVWGAEGGSMNSGYPGVGGRGGYTAGTINLNKGTKLYVYVGGVGTGYKSGSSVFAGGWNGGGTCYGGASGGGGATDVRLVKGDWNDSKSLNSRLIVAGAGGGSNDSTNGGAGGGLTGATGAGGSTTNATGGRQVQGGVGALNGSFGTGAGSNNSNSDGGAGGGGYFGGGKALGYNVAGGGGSSYASGYLGCVAVSGATNTNPRKDAEGDPCTEAIASNDVTCSYHYSGYILKDIVMTSGEHVMPTHAGKDEMTGNTGAGYAVITPLSAKSENNFLRNITTNISKLEELFSPTKYEYTITVGMYNQYITLEGIRYDERATVFGDGKLKIEVGENILPITVTAENGDIRTYTVKVIREGLKGKHSNVLNYIKLDGYDDIYVTSGVNNYNFNLDYNKYGVKVTPVAYDVDAIIEVTGSDVTADNDGDITITVRHEDNSIATEIYKITYHRQIPLYTPEDEYTYSCIREPQEFIAFLDGNYKIELWGASGGGGSHSLNAASRGGNGGYTYGTINLKQGELLNVYVGCAGTYSNKLGVGGGYNGGGHGGPGGYGGGGATDIRYKGDTYQARIMVAGGGGGADNSGGSLNGGDDGSGGAGGGEAGENARINGSLIPNTGGTQTSGYALGVGESASRSTDTGGAGGGYYGGKVTNNNNGGAGGGSGYIDSELFKNARTILGNQMVPTFDGEDIMLGNASNGYAKITPLNLKSENDYLEELIYSDGTISPEFDPGKTDYVITVGTYTQSITLTGKAYDSNAIVTGNGDFDLDMGENEFKITVTSHNGTIRTYNITVLRPLLNDGTHTAELQKIKINGYEDILCMQGIYEYTIKIPESVFYLDVTPVPYDGSSTQTLSGFSYIETSSIATITSRVTGKRIVYKINIEKAGAQDKFDWEYKYTGEVQKFIAPMDGTYKLEAWGAQGGNRAYNRGGRGAYATGYVKLKQNEFIYVYVGGSGNTGGKSGGWNGGGARSYYAGGGGATDFRLEIDDLYTRILVAGGGGSVGSSGHYGGNAGGEGNGGSTSGYGNGGSGASQTQAGAHRASFGVGGSGVSGSGGHAGAGGGGWYGGGGANPDVSADDDRGGGGGSSFALTKESTSKTPFNYKVGEKYYLTHTKLLSGGESMPSHDGTEKMTGNTGDGYAKVTYVNVSDNNFLASLTVKSGQEIKEFNRDFASETYDYILNLASDETKINISARPADSKATIEGLGEKDVPATETTYTITVTSESGKERDYRIKVIREADHDNKPKNIKISGLIGNYCDRDDSYCLLNPENFDNETYSYTMTVPYKIKQLNFAVDKGVETQVVNGEGLITLNDARNPDTYISIEVQSEYCALNNDFTSDGCLSTYMYTITRDVAGDNDLRRLEVNDPSRELHFDPDIYEYTISIPYEYDYIKDLVYEADNANASVIVSGNEDMELGYNYVYLTVTAPNGDIQVYTLNVYREKSTKTYLDHLEVYSLDKNDEKTKYQLEPEYNYLKFATYDVNIPNDIRDVYFDTDVVATGLATYTFSSKNVNITSDGHITDLPVGYSFVYITVTAQDGSTDTYVIRLNRLKNSNVNVNNIDLYVEDTKINLSESFNPDVLMYDASVPIGTKEVRFDVSLEEPTTTKVTYPNGLKLVAGFNEKIVRITAEDGTVRNYTFNIYRPYNTTNTLDDIKILNGEEELKYTPDFSPNVNEYSLTVPNNINVVTIIGELTDESSTLKGSGLEYHLSSGTNKITLTVISENGSENYYTIEITRTPSDNKNVSFFTVEPTGHVITTEENNYHYSVSVECDYDEVEIIPTLASDVATYEIIESGNPLTSDDVNTFRIKVIAEDGTNEIYIIDVYKDKSNNANLAHLLVEEGALSPNFKSDIIDYTVIVPNDVTSGHYHYETESGSATVTISGDLVFNVGENNVKVTVTPESGEDDNKEYNIKVIRQAYNPLSDTLSSLAVKPGTLTPDFSSSRQYYEVEVENEVDKIYVGGITTDAASMVSGFGYYDLKVGRNIIVIRVMTSDNQNQRDYQIVVTRKGSSEARIKNLALNGNILNPDFNPDIYLYNIDTSATSLDFAIVELMHEGATYKIINNKFNDVNQEHEVKIEVTAEDKLTKKEYIFKVHRHASSNSYLKSLSIDNYEIKPKFNKNTTMYNLSVNTNLGSIVVNAEAEDDMAVVIGKGSVLLPEVKNNIEIIVEAEDGSTRTYTIVVTRKASSDATLRRLVVNNGVLDIPFDKDNLEYDVTVPATENYLDISYNTTDPNANVYTSEKELTTDPQDVEIVVTAEDGITKNKYILHVKKGPIVSSLLGNLEIKDYLLTPTFDSNIFEYDILLNNEDTKIEIDKIKALDPNATINIPDLTGFTEDDTYYQVQIEVISSNNVDKSYYTLNIYHQSAANNYLQYITYSLPEQDSSIYFPTPTFNKLTKTYYITVSNDITKIYLDAGAANDLDITGLGLHTNLEVGLNILPITVTCEGVKRTYIVKVTREANDSNLLSNLIIKSSNKDYSSKITPAFDPEIKDYYLTVDAGTTYLELSGSVSNRAIVNGLKIWDINPGTNVLSIVITAENGDVNSYKITVTRPISDDNTLIDLVPSTGRLEPSFKVDVTNYDLYLNSSDTKLSFDCRTKDNLATIIGIDEEYVNDGDSTRLIIVKSETGDEKTYTINIHKSADNNAYLKSLSVKDGEFDVDFNPQTLTYEVTVPNTKKILTSNDVTAIPSDGDATVIKSGSINLSTKNKTTYTVVVTAADGITTITYHLNVIREIGTLHTLASLVPKTGYLQQTFKPESTQYTYLIPPIKTSVSIDDFKYTLSDDNSVITYSEPIDMTDEDHPDEFIIRVMAEDNSGYTEYTIKLKYDYNSDNTLSSLKVENGHMLQAFKTGLYTYDVYEYETTTEEIVTATTTNQKASIISGIGKIDITGDECYDYIIVRAEDGSLLQYTLHFINTFKTDTGLDKLFVEGLITDDEEDTEMGEFEPAFTSDVIDYEVNVPFEYKVLNMGYVRKNEEQTVKYKINDTYIENNKYVLPKGSTNLLVEVYDGLSRLTTTYNVKINRLESKNANLSSLLLINPETNKTYDLTPKFNSTTYEYEIEVPNDLDVIKVKATTVFSGSIYSTDEDENNIIYKEKSTAIVNFNGYTYLNEGDNQVTATVTSPDGTVLQYLVHVIKQPLYNSWLKQITVTTGEFWDLTPDFRKTNKTYTITMPSQIDKVSVNAVPDDPTTVVRGTGDYDLELGMNIITLVATAIDGSVSTYQVGILQEPNRDVDLSSLEINECDLSPGFDKTTVHYTCNVDPNIRNLTVKAIPEDPSAKVHITGDKNLITGNNLLEIQVVSKDKALSKTYQIEVYKGINNNADLSNLVVYNINDLGETNYYDLSPEFDPSTTDYEVEVPYDIESVIISVTKSAITSRTIGSGVQYLNFGDNDIVVSVIAEDNKTKKDYNIKIKRNYNLRLKSLDLSAGTLTPEFSPNTTSYTLSVPNKTKNIYIEGHPYDNVITVTGNGSYDVYKEEARDILIALTAPNGDTNTYIIKAKEEKNGNPYASSISVKEGALTPIFNPKTKIYEVNVKPSVIGGSVDITVVPEEKTTTYKITGNENLKLGENKVYVEMTAEDNTKYTYELRINVKDAEFFVNKLSGISLSVPDSDYIVSMNPDFDPDTNSYQVVVPYSIEQLTIASTTTNPYATITGNETIDLPIGRSVHNIKVSSPDTEDNIYSLNIYRLEDDANLSMLSVKNHNFTFNKTTYSYNITIDHDETILDITAIPVDPSATVEITGNGGFVVGHNEVTIKVTTLTGKEKTYTLNVNTKADSNPYLEELEIVDYKIRPDFDSTADCTYLLTVPSNVSSIYIKAKTVKDTTTKTGDGAKSLDFGANTFVVNTEAEDGTKFKYTIVVTRLVDSNSKLSNIEVTPGELKPTFKKSIEEYEVVLESDTTAIRINATADSENATVEGNGTYYLTSAETEIPITVTASNGDKTIYKVTVKLESYASSLLASLRVKEGELIPNFLSEGFNYNVVVPYEISSLNFIYATVDDNAIVHISGNDHFEIGINEVKITVLSSDGKNTSTYTISVIRQPYANDYLKELSVTSTDKLINYTLTPEFDQNILYYEVKVPNNIAKVRINATKADSSNVLSSNNIGVKNLSVGENVFPITVYSLSGYQRTYTVIITRQTAEESTSDSYLISLDEDVEEASLSPDFSSDVTNYSITVPSTTSTITFTGSSPAGTNVTGLGKSILKYGTSQRTISVTGTDGNVKNYYITIIRPYTDNTKVTKIIPSVGTLNYEEGKTEYDMEVPGETSKISFEVITSDPKAKVTGNEETTLQSGLNIITITITGTDGETKNIHIFITKKSSVDAITLAKNSIIIGIGENVSIDYEFTPADTDYTDVTWASDDDTIASVALNGLITGKKVGKTKITITSDTNEDASDTIDVEVINKKLINKTYTIVRKDDDKTALKDYVYTLKHKIAIKDFIETFDNKLELVHIYNEDNVEIDTSSTTYLGTGMIVTLELDNNTIDRLLVVVKGDINGDGLLTAPDVSNVNNVILGLENNWLNRVVSDVNIDGSVSAGDNQLVSEVILGNADSIYDQIK